MCENAGIQGRKTNHSARKTAATKLYQAGVDEQQIKEVTHHHSDAVRHYKVTSMEQKRKVSNILAGATDLPVKVPKVEKVEGPLKVPVGPIGFEKIDPEKIEGVYMPVSSAPAQVLPSDQLGIVESKSTKPA